jgi:hypothetical protein
MKWWCGENISANFVSGDRRRNLPLKHNQHLLLVGRLDLLVVDSAVRYGAAVFGVRLVCWIGSTLSTAAKVSPNASRIELHQGPAKWFCIDEGWVLPCGGIVIPNVDL